MTCFDVLIFGVDLSLYAFVGIIMLIGGIVILVQPAISLLTLAWVVGIWLIIIGIYEIIAAFMVRNRTKSLA
jgi:uncharacterized membrane protein HdeD (DUF308 family)